jgi:hypothetical protein
MAALFSGFVLVRDRLDLDAAVKVAVLAIIIAAVNIAWLVMGAALTRLFGIRAATGSSTWRSQCC